MLCDPYLGNLQVKKNKGWDQEDKVVSSANTIFSKETQKPPKTVILLQIVLVSPSPEPMSPSKNKKESEIENA